MKQSRVLKSAGAGAGAGAGASAGAVLLEVYKRGAKATARPCPTAGPLEPFGRLLANRPGGLREREGGRETQAQTSDENRTVLHDR